MNPKEPYRVEDLINLVRQCPILYDRDHPEFRNKEHREQYWQEIGKRLKSTSEAVEKRWKSLREVYGRHLRAEMNQQEEVASKKPWIWAELMEPFRNHFKFNERQAPEMIHVSADPNMINTQFYDTATDMSEETRDTLAQYLKTNNALEFLKSQMRFDQHRSQKPTSAKKRKMVEPSTPRATAAARLVQPTNTPVPSNSTPARHRPVEQNANATNATITSPAPQEQTVLKMNTEAGAPPLDAMDHFMLKCAKRMKQLPPEVQADLQIEISRVITQHENNNLLKINSWQNK